MVFTFPSSLPFPFRDLNLLGPDGQHSVAPCPSLPFVSPFANPEQIERSTPTLLRRSLRHRLWPGLKSQSWPRPKYYSRINQGRYKETGRSQPSSVTAIKETRAANLISIHHYQHLRHHHRHQHSHYYPPSATGFATPSLQSEYILSLC